MAFFSSKKDFTLDSGLFALVSWHHTNYLVTQRRRKVYTLRSVFTEHALIPSISAITETCMGSNLPGWIITWHWELFIIEDEAFTFFIALDCCLTIFLKVRPWKEEEIIVAVAIVVHVHPVERLTIQLREKRIVTVLITVQSFVTLFCIVNILGVNNRICQDE